MLVCGDEQVAHSLVERPAVCRSAYRRFGKCKPFRRAQVDRLTDLGALKSAHRHLALAPAVSSYAVAG